MEKDDRYQKGKIYQVVCNVTGKCYIGSTRQTLSARLSGHRDNYNKYLKGGKAFCKSYHIIENDVYKK